MRPPVYHNPLNEIQQQAMLELWHKGMGGGAIAQELGVSQGSVECTIRKLKLKKRSRQELLELRRRNGLSCVKPGGTNNFLNKAPLSNFSSFQWEK